MGPLAGIRVIDFSRVLAGPHCAKTLHDLGAEVIKIEPPRPDISRAAIPRNEGMSYYYIQQNTGKRNISLDLNHAEARAIPPTNNVLTSSACDGKATSNRNSYLSTTTAKNGRAGG
ncbi:CoA transferase [Bradyrhizobium erythrophlei]|nr:CoA transferase [Bradyrhizobium erythrophlei]